MHHRRGRRGIISGWSPVISGLAFLDRGYRASAQRRHGLDDFDPFAVLFDQVADVDDALVAGARALFGGWVFGVR
jgi:hypothetical protein